MRNYLILKYNENCCKNYRTEHGTNKHFNSEHLQSTCRDVQIHSTKYYSSATTLTYTHSFSSSLQPLALQADCSLYADPPQRMYYHSAQASPQKGMMDPALLHCLKPVHCWCYCYCSQHFPSHDHFVLPLEQDSPGFSSTDLNTRN